MVMALWLLFAPRRSDGSGIPVRSRRQPRVVSSKWILDPRLVRLEGRVAMPRENSRYWNVIGDKLIGKTFRDVNCYTIMTCLDGCEVEEIGPYKELCLNLGLWVSGDLVVGIGGEAGDNGLSFQEMVDLRHQRAKRTEPEEDGVWVVRAPSLEVLKQDGWSGRWPAFDGFNHDCIEKYKGSCQFDAKFSIADLGDTIFVYARANLNQTGGGRYVQVISTTKEQFVKGTFVDFTNFQTIQFAEGHLPRFPSTTEDLDYCREHADQKVLKDYSHYINDRDNDIYMFLVNPHPLRSDILIAIFPMTIHYGCGLISMAFSLDGVRFTAPHPIIASECFRRKGRTFDHPVDGFIPVFENDSLKSLDILVQVNVNDIAGNNTHDYPRHFARYSLNSATLATQTDRAVKAWHHAFSG